MIFFALTACTLSASTTDTSENTNNPYAFPPHWQTLLFGIYSLNQPELGSAQQDGYTAVGPYHRNSPKSLNSAQQSGLPLIYRVGPKVDFTNSDEILRQQQLLALAEEVAANSQKSGISIWYLANEELRFWREDEIQWLEQATATIRENDPYKRPIMMYEPNHRNAPGLQETSQFLDFVSKGAYANHVGMEHKRSWIRFNVEQTVAAARATDQTPVAVLWMARDQKKDNIQFIHDWARHDVYLSLITGAKGIMIWSGSNRRQGFSKHFEGFYKGYASAAQELNGPQDLAKFFLFGEPQSSVHALVVDGPKEQSFKYRDKTYNYPSLSSRQYVYKGQNYFFMVNSSDQTIRTYITGIPTTTDVYNVFSKKIILDNGAINMSPYQVNAVMWAITE